MSDSATCAIQERTAFEPLDGNVGLNEEMIPPSEPLSGTESDRLLVNQVISGDPEAAVRFFTDRCMSVFIGVVNRTQQGFWITPMELCNDVFLHLAANNWEKLRRFEFRCSLKTWVWTIALHLLYRKYRKEKKHIRNTVAFDLLENQLPVENEIADEKESWIMRGERNCSVVVDSEEVVPIVRRALDRIRNPYYRKLIELRGIRGLSSIETAKLLKRSPCAVDQGFCRAKKELRKIIEAEHGELPRF